MKPSSEITLLLQSIDEGYSKKAWHGPNLRGSIRGLTAKESAWRPGKDRHNIWEIVVHCAYWKYAARRRLLGEKRGSFPLRGSNWFTRPDGKPNEDDWRQDIRLLEEMHRAMVDAISDLKASDLKVIPRGSKVDNRAIIAGIAMHDVYHAGQVQLMKRMM
ncbi:MAG: DinB family protein [Ignavibacteriae bacterium]|nr:DinB family protein [Ignavibacteria bacterium]MBI3364185.1 DinB family protein [Ignavibacteriota bacterium]